jgi:hypothetical protein
LKLGDPIDRRSLDCDGANVEWSALATVAGDRHERRHASD